MRHDGQVTSTLTGQRSCPIFAFFVLTSAWEAYSLGTIVLPQPLSAEARMLDADFWLDQALMFRQQADTVRDPGERDELRVLAQICDAVATKIEEHVSGG
jgi:hypothetical protein